MQAAKFRAALEGWAQWQNCSLLLCIRLWLSTAASFKGDLHSWRDWHLTSHIKSTWKDKGTAQTWPPQSVGALTAFFKRNLDKWFGNLLGEVSLWLLLVTNPVWIPWSVQSWEQCLTRRSNRIFGHFWSSVNQSSEPVAQTNSAGVIISEVSVWICILQLCPSFFSCGTNCYLGVCREGGARLFGEVYSRRMKGNRFETKKGCGFDRGKKGLSWVWSSNWTENGLSILGDNSKFSWMRASASWCCWTRFEQWSLSIHPRLWLCYEAC